MKISAIQCLNQQQLIARKHDLQAQLMQNNMSYLNLIGAACYENPEQLNSTETLLMLNNISIQFQLKLIEEQLKASEKKLDYQA